MVPAGLGVEPVPPILGFLQIWLVDACGGAVIARSFARIHETNLKKQGLLALTFSSPDDYDKIREDDRISLTGLNELAPGKSVPCTVSHSDGTSEELSLNHTLGEPQIEWFRLGSALNLFHQS